MNRFLNVSVAGRDLIGVQNLIKKHQVVLVEINNHDSRISGVIDSGKQMMEDEHFASDEIRNRVNALYDHWVQLKDKSNQVCFNQLYSSRKNQETRTSNIEGENLS